MSLILVLQLLTLILVSLLGLLVLYKKPRSIIHRYFWLFATATAGWNLSLFLAISELGHPTFWGRMAFFFGIVMSLGLFLFSDVFISRNQRRFLTKIAVLFGIIFSALSFSDLIVMNIEIVNKTYLTGVLSPLYFAYLAYFLGFLITGFVVFIIKYRKKKGIEKTQLGYVITGILSFFIPFFITQMILPIFGLFQYNNLGPLFSLPMVALIAYAIVRHQFLDIRVVIQRGLIFTFLLTVIIVSYLVGVFLLGFVFQKTTNLTFLLSGAITTLVGVFGVPVIERYFRSWTNRIFFKGKYVFSKAIEDISTVLNNNIDLVELTRELQLVLRGIFRTNTVNIVYIEPSLILTSSANFETLRNKYSKEAVAELRDPWVILHSEIPVYLNDPDRTESYKAVLRELRDRVRKNSIEVTVPVTLTDKLVCIITLGDKLSGDPYTSEDIRLLRSVARTAAVAFENARLYEEAKIHNRDLEGKVRRRTAKIKSLQEEQNQMLNEIAHSLQTPLTIAKNHLELLKERVQDAPELPLVSTSLDKTSKFVYEILHLGKLESSSNAIEKEPVDLSDLLQEQVEYIEVLAKEKSIQVISDIEPNLVIEGNKAMLEELIINLISNAEKYMSEEGERNIFVSLSKKNDSVVLEVRDTGIGLSDEDLHAIFRKFYRAKHAEVAGTGLGLAICKKIVEKHDGDIQVESALGKGTTFMVVFPLRLSH